MPATLTTVRCQRQGSTYIVVSFANAAGKQKTLQLLGGLLSASGTTFSVCDGGLWIVTGNTDTQGNLTPAQVKKLNTAARMARTALGCTVTPLAK